MGTVPPDRGAVPVLCLSCFREHLAYIPCGQAPPALGVDQKRTEVAQLEAMMAASPDRKVPLRHVAGWLLAGAAFWGGAVLAAVQFVTGWPL